MEEVRERIDRGDADREVEEIIQVRWLSTQTRSSADSSLFFKAMCDIAKDRARKLEQSAKI